MKTAGLWPWKSASAKECVTTHRPNAEASKMDGAEPMMIPISRFPRSFGFLEK